MRKIEKIEKIDNMEKIEPKRKKKREVKKMILTIMLVIASIVGIIFLAIVINVLVTNWKMKHMTLTERLDYVFEKYEDKRKSGGMAFLVEDENGFT